MARRQFVVTRLTEVAAFEAYTLVPGDVITIERGETGPPLATFIVRPGEGPREVQAWIGRRQRQAEDWFMLTRDVAAHAQCGDPIGPRPYRFY